MAKVNTPETEILKEKKLQLAEKHLREAVRHYRESEDDLALADVQNGLDVISGVSVATNISDEKEEILQIVDALNSLSEKLGMEVVVDVQEDAVQDPGLNEPTTASEIPEDDFSDIADLQESDPALYQIMEGLDKKNRTAYKRLIEATKLCVKAHHFMESGELDQVQAPLDQASQAVTEVGATEGLAPEVQASIQEVENAVEGLKASVGMTDTAGTEVQGALSGDTGAGIPPEGEQPQQLQESNKNSQPALREGKKDKSLIDYLLTAANGVPEDIPVENWAPNKGFSPSKDTVGNPTLTQAKSVPAGRTNGVKKTIPSAEAAESKRSTIVYAKAARKRIQEQLSNKFTAKKFSFSELDELF